MFTELKYTKFTNNPDIKIKHKIDEKIIVYSYFIDCDFKKFETINKEERIYVFEILFINRVASSKEKVKNPQAKGWQKQIKER